MTYQQQSLEDTTGTAWVNITDGGDFSTTTTDTLNVDTYLLIPLSGLE